MTLGKRLRQARTAAGLTQRALAELAGVNAAKICRFEGDDITPSLATFRRLSLALGARADWLLDLPLQPWKAP